MSSAAGWLERGCVQLDPAACANFAVLLVDGRGRPADPVRAQQLFRWSCDRHDPLGCRNAGFNARETDRVAAIRDLGIACDLGDGLACAWLGDLYDGGDPRDEVRARVQYARACERGEPRGCASRDALDDRVHPIEEVVVDLFQVGYAGAPLATAARTEPEARTLADEAVGQLHRGVPLAQVAEAYGDHPTVGPTVREQRLIRAKTPSALQDAAFGLAPGGIAIVPVPSLGYLVVIRRP
jgi:hypothetical protein